MSPETHFLDMIDLLGLSTYASFVDFGTLLRRLLACLNCAKTLQAGRNDEDK